MGREFLVFVIVDVEAGEEEQVLAGLTENLESEAAGPFGAAAIWEIHQGSDYAVELRLPDAAALEDLDRLLIDKIRSVPGVTETTVRPIFNFRFIDAEGSKKAFDAARSESPEILGVVLCDVECGKDRAVHEALLSLKPAADVVPVDVETGFQSVDFDLSVLLVGPSESAFHQYIKRQIRPIDGVRDTVCEVWEIAQLLAKDDKFVSGWSAMSGE